MNQPAQQIDLDVLSREELERLLIRRTTELETLVEFNRRVASRFDLPGLLQEIIDTIRDTYPAEAVSIILPDEVDGDLYFYASSDSREESIVGSTIPSGEGIAGRVIDTGESILVTDASKDDRVFKEVDAKTGMETRNLICAPLKIGSRILGAVEAMNRLGRPTFTEEDLRLLEVVGTQAAMAIEYARTVAMRIQDERMTAVGRMAGQIIHDLKNSMNMISGIAQLMIMDHPEFDQYSDQINDEIERVRDMAADVLQYAKGEISTCNLKPENIGKYITDFYNSNQAIMQKEKIHFVLQDAPDLDVCLDGSRMYRVLANLLTNAKQSLLDQNRTIVLALDYDEHHVRIKVRDTGKGMNESVQRRLFEPFFTSGKKDGTGLGMAIVRSIVEGHYGKIELDSIEGEGTEFRIILDRKLSCLKK